MLVVLAMPAHAEYMWTSYYGWEVAYNYTASGDIFYPYGYTAASMEYPFGTVLGVYYGGNYVEVTVNDRGPAYWTGRQLDLSLGAAEAIGLAPYVGVDYVDVYVLYDPTAYSSYYYGV
jgi:rare lipoprotein A